MSPFKNAHFAAIAKLLLAFALGAGTAVAAAYNTFETAAHHASDQERTEQMLQEIRNDVKTLLGRTAQQFRVPKVAPPVQPQRQVKEKVDA